MAKTDFCCKVTNLAVTSSEEPAGSWAVHWFGPHPASVPANLHWDLNPQCLSTSIKNPITFTRAKLFNILSSGTANASFCQPHFGKRSYIASGVLILIYLCLREILSIPTVSAGLLPNASSKSPCCFFVYLSRSASQKLTPGFTLLGFFMKVALPGRALTC